MIEVWARGRRGKTRPVCVDAFPFSYLLWLRFITSFGSFFLPFVVPFPYLFDSVFLLFGLHFLTFLGSSFLPFFWLLFSYRFWLRFLTFCGSIFSHLLFFLTFVGSLFSAFLLRFLTFLAPFSYLLWFRFLTQFDTIFSPSMTPFSSPFWFPFHPFF